MPTSPAADVQLSVASPGSPKSKAAAALAANPPPRPDKLCNDAKGRNPEERSGFLSKLVFWFMVPLINTGYKRTLTATDVPDIAKTDDVDSVKDRLTALWKRQQEGGSPSYFKSLFIFMGPSIAVMLLFNGLAVAASIAQPIILYELLTWLVEYQFGIADATDGWKWAGVLFALPLANTLFDSQANYVAVRNMVRLRAAVCAMVYEKSLVIRSVADGTKKDGKGKEGEASDKSDKSKKQRRRGRKGKQDAAGSKENSKGENEDGDSKEGDKDKGKDKDKDGDDEDDGAASMSTGKIVNLMTSDAEAIGRMAYTTAYAILVPIQVAVILYLLYDTIGVSAFAGLGVMLAAFPIMAVVLVKSVGYSKAKLGHMDKRVKLTNEVLQGVRVVKFYAWEKSFMARITGIRAQELEAILGANLWIANLSLTLIIMPALIPFVSFALYAYKGNEFDAPTIFRALGLFNGLGFPIFRLPSSLSDMIVGHICAKRVQSFLERPETDSGSARVAPSEDSGPCRVEITGDACFAWDAAEDPTATNATAEGGDNDNDNDNDSPASAAALPPPTTLAGINFHANAGEITAVVGEVASGKTSLLHAILGEINKVSGGVKVQGSLAYVAQSAWIQNMTIRDNILFGQAYDRKRYDACIAACALAPDLEILPAKDFTEIGDRGINLSGGQKQRVALARALYSDADVYLLDDPLSAVDANVGEAIFSRCIKTALRNKTVVFVTNQLHLVTRCDRAYVMQAGRIAQHGTPEELSRDPSFAQLMQAHLDDLQGKDSAEAAADEEQMGKGVAAVAALSPLSTAAGAVADDAGLQDIPALVRMISAGSDADEVSALGRRGSISRTVFSSIASPDELPQNTHGTTNKLKAGRQSQDEEIVVGSVGWEVYKRHFQAMGGALYTTAFFLFLLLGTGISAFGTFWLSYWTERKWGKSDRWFVSGFMILIGSCFVVLVIRNWLFAKTQTRAAKVHHERLLHSVMRGSSLFYDATPLGRILNRFSRDTGNVDSTLPRFFLFTMGIVSQVFVSLAGTSAVSPWFSIVVVLAALAFYLLQRFYKPSALMLQRLEAVSRSPIYAHFSESLLGLTTIRAFGAQRRFAKHAMEQVNSNSQCILCLRLVFQWTTVQVGIINAVLTCSSVIFVVLARDDINPGQAGASISLVLGVGGVVGFLIILLTELENQLNSVERISFYTTDVPPEASWDQDELEVPADWPKEAAVEFDEIVMKYRADLEPAIKGVSLAFKPGEKIGVVGRTGSGKSTLLLSLMRMYEVESGRITIDGLDVAKLGLHTLRKHVAIIPQDPVVFSGTMRDNLDPFGEYQDDAIWAALQHADLDEAVRVLKGGLDATVAEYGSNFSQGQRQLICMARAILRRPRILLMDEATSSVDVQTDRLLQATVRAQFADATVITIAHRLNTVMDADRIVVLDEGKLAEFDAPQTLLAKENGIFASMYEAMQHSSHGPAAEQGKSKGSLVTIHGSIGAIKEEHKADDEGEDAVGPAVNSGGAQV